MESSADHYLHKKFKKQLSLEPRSSQNHDKENKNTAIRPVSEEKPQKSEEKTPSAQLEESPQDNNDRVPNQSTNQLSSYSVRSSISVENQQSENPCISYVVSNHQEDLASFDTRYSDQLTNYTVSNSSSILEERYGRPVSSSDEPYPPYNPHHYSQKSPEDNPTTSEEVQPAVSVDKASNGKYVCPYCNLVCSKPSVLQKHIRAHTNERPYPCKSCGFSFKTRSNLYKHCRSRTHANRVMGNKMSTNEGGETIEPSEPMAEVASSVAKPYKPRFHTAAKEFFEKDTEEESPVVTGRHPASEMLSQHINEIINKNNSIVNSATMTRYNEDLGSENSYQNSFTEPKSPPDEPLNLSNKSRKRSMSEVTEPVIQKSLIKELLLKNLSSSDMQCPYCKMIFRTVTELDIHKYRNCKGKPSGAKYSRSSSVNVASILTQNKNAFDNIPQLQNTIFPLNSPGPFLGKTRLVDSDKNKSFSFDGGNMPLASPSEPSPSPNYLLSPLPFDKEKKPGVKLYGGEVRVHPPSGKSQTFHIDGKEVDKYEPDSNYIEYGGKLSENRVVKSSLHSGGTVLTNKTNYDKQDLKMSQEVIRVYENTSISPSIDIGSYSKSKFTFDRQSDRVSDVIIQQTSVTSVPRSSPTNKYTNIMDFSQKAVQKLTPNIKQPIVSLGSKPLYNNLTIETRSDLSPMLTDSEPVIQKKIFYEPNHISSNPAPKICNPLNLFVNGKVVRHVPGMPGPVTPEEPTEITYGGSNIIAIRRPVPSLVPEPASPLVLEKSHVLFASKQMETGIIQNDKPRELINRSPKSPKIPLKSLHSENVEADDFPSKPLPVEHKSKLDVDSDPVIKKFSRPNSLALKPTTASLKQHHGLTPTKFNQILISPDTPRVAKKYAEHFLHGNYFSYLGLKSSTKPVYCTLNKTQPFYVHHFKKLSMYSEWRQQDTKQDKLYVSNYDSRQKSQRYSVAGKTKNNSLIHSSYKFMVSELATSKSQEKEDQLKMNAVVGGFESSDEYTYIRGRGRGRYVCQQCGIRCKKPSVLKKHIRTHSNDRPYTCEKCHFSFKTKGNLTKHMKSKSHTKNYSASATPIQKDTNSSDSDSETTDEDSSDESTRQQEHEAAYGLLSLSQKPTPGNTIAVEPSNSSDIFMSSEEIAYVSKTNYAKNKILDERNVDGFKRINEVPVSTVSEPGKQHGVTEYLGKCTSRPLTYPYTNVLQDKEVTPHATECEQPRMEASPEHPKSIKQFHVIQKYVQPQLSPKLQENKKVELSPRKKENHSIVPENVVLNNKKNVNITVNRVLPTLKINDVIVANDGIVDPRKRKYPPVENSHKNKIQRNEEVMDLSKPDRMNGIAEPLLNNVQRPIVEPQKNVANEIYNTLQKVSDSPHRYDLNEDEDSYGYRPNDSFINNRTVVIVRPLQSENHPNVNYTNPRGHSENGYDNSAMETLADVATKQVKLEKNMLAKSVASEFLKLATKNDGAEMNRDTTNFTPVSKDVNDIIVKSEGNKNCTICSKSFNKPSQLRLHMNIHYLERPFRCDSCSVSFRTKGHLQKHERSAGHHNKLSSSPALSTSEPRPFKCADCNIAFRIHGHLAKHLRSKMHIMKLECLAKVPFGLYAELERSNSLLTEINTCDGDQCLESLKTLAKKVFMNDPNKLSQLEPADTVSADC
ncbi:unnamed protein product [Callosobruchus maculatus]|uniref:C2H2-type domain-containing protein n=1 Tax=Callosobruchus maculatus TaxID=64391 RepID=A0A653C803_CALMS|nr:unnamed protein product [Callosobruchus maculatus]